MKVAVVGIGYVGLVAGACFADVGIEVTCVDIDERKLDTLRRNEVPFFEPHLADILRRNHPDRLSFSSDLGASVADAKVVFVAGGTPARDDGTADLHYVLDVSASVVAAGLAYRGIGRPPQD
jgi:UDPglucose 6-dehydrogenase